MMALSFRLISLSVIKKATTLMAMSIMVMGEEEKSMVGEFKI
jgi:hypothetical protein